MNVNGKGAAMSGLTDQIRHSVTNPLTSTPTDFDFAAVLDDVLSTVGLSVTDAGGNVRFYGGADPFQLRQPVVDFRRLCRDRMLRWWRR